MRRCLMCFVLCFLLTGCQAKPAGFSDIWWSRETEVDTETIYFGSDGSFRYSCGCGNPVNDADLCEGYAYDEKRGVIQLDCMEPTEEMVTEIAVIAFDEDRLELDFDGEIRIFEKE